MTGRGVIVPQNSIELLDKVVMYAGKLARIVGVSEGRTIHMRFVEEPPCPACGHQPGADMLAHSPLFQSNVEPAPTLETFG